MTPRIRAEYAKLLAEYEAEISKTNWDTEKVAALSKLIGAFFPGNHNPEKWTTDEFEAHQMQQELYARRLHG